MDVNVLTWNENGQANTIYVQVSDAVAKAFAEALPDNCTDVALSKFVTATQPMALK